MKPIDQVRRGVCFLSVERCIVCLTVLLNTVRSNTQQNQTIAVLQSKHAYLANQARAVLCFRITKIFVKKLLSCCFQCRRTQFRGVLVCIGVIFGQTNKNGVLLYSVETVVYKTIHTHNFDSRTYMTGAVVGKRECEKRRNL